MSVESGFAEVNGTRLYYEIAGSGEPLVLLHGFSLDTRMWNSQFLTFAEQYRVLRYDLRGFGKSAVPTESYSHIDDLHALMQSLKIEQAHVLGLSLGGHHAMSYALAHPQLIRTLTLVDSVLVRFQWNIDFASLPALANSQGVQAARHKWFHFDIFAAARQLPDVSSQLEAIINDYSGWDWLNHDPVRELDPFPSYQLDKITAPTLIIVGEKDLPDFRKIANILEQQIPKAHKVVMAGAGHMPNMEQPDKFNKIVLDFLSERAGKV